MLRYRREDAAAYAGRLYDRLAAEFGQYNVFMDIDTIRPADHFGDITEQTLASARWCWIGSSGTLEGCHRQRRSRLMPQASQMMAFMPVM